MATPSPSPLPALVPLPFEIRFPDAPGVSVSPATTIFIQSTDPTARFVAEFLAGLLTTVGPVGPSVVQMGSAIPEGSIVLSLDPTVSANPAEGDRAKPVARSLR